MVGRIRPMGPSQTRGYVAGNLGTIGAVMMIDDDVLTLADFPEILSVVTTQAATKMHLDGRKTNKYCYGIVRQYYHTST